MNDLIITFNLDINNSELVDKAKAQAKAAVVTLACGLMFYAFTKADSQVSLRDHIVRHYGLLDKYGIDKSEIPKALRTRCEAALVFEVAV